MNNMVKKINEQEYKDAIKEGVSIVDFNAKWCGPCKMLAPILEEVSNEYDGNVKFYSVDTDENMELAASLGISSIPAIMAFANGTIIGQTVGFMPKEELKEWINQFIK